jgi:hypothetical protein
MDVNWQHFPPVITLISLAGSRARRAIACGEFIESASRPWCGDCEKKTQLLRLKKL